MREETHDQPVTSSPSEPTLESVPMSATVQSRSTLIKDLLIPVSIIIAGLFIGAGLYFGGTSPTAVPVAQAPVQPVDNTDKVDPVTVDDHIKGNLDAAIKIVEYSDFDCPFCSRFHDSMTNISEKYSDDELAWVYRHLPIEQIHPQAPGVAIASECMAEIGGNEAFWNFADAYYAARGSGDKTAHSELIPKLVTGAGVNQQAFTECFESGRYIDDIQADMNDAAETGGTGTPWIIIIGPTGKTYPIEGALPQQAIEQFIEVAKQEA
ncbi:MAG: protein-disulfide isomerase [Candidatus Paceibacteria bacterium]|jgi:protein-disulfide isomerase